MLRSNAACHRFGQDIHIFSYGKLLDGCKMAKKLLLKQRVLRKKTLFHASLKSPFENAAMNFMLVLSSEASELWYFDCQLIKSGVLITLRIELCFGP